MYLLFIAQQQGPVRMFDMWPLFVIFLILWFMIIRPQRKEQKKREEMLRNIKKGDKIVTNGGIIGKIVKIKDKDFIEVKVDESNNTKLTFLRSAVINVLNNGQDLKDKK